MIGHAPQHSVSLYRRAVVLSAVGTALAAAAATRLQAPLGADARYPLRVAVIGGGLLIAALVGLARSHRFARLGSANILTGARALAVALIAGLLYGAQLSLMVPKDESISWQGHLFGFIGGAVAGLVTRRPSPKPAAAAA